MFKHRTSSHLELQLKRIVLPFRFARYSYSVATSAAARPFAAPNFCLRELICAVQAHTWAPPLVKSCSCVAAGPHCRAPCPCAVTSIISLVHIFRTEVPCRRFTPWSRTCLLLYRCQAQGTEVNHSDAVGQMLRPSEKMFAIST